MKNILYHYCSNETFRKILEKPQFRLTDITKSNDREEIIFLWNEYKRFYSEKYPEALPTQLLKFEINKMLSKMHFLTMCFSENADSLHLWNMYSKDGGVALGFDKESLEELSHKIIQINNGVSISGKGSSSTCRFEKVEYFDEIKASEYIEKKCDNSELVIDAMPSVFYDAPFSKTDFWQEEKEWRLVIPHYQDDNNHIDIEKLNELLIDSPQKTSLTFESNNRSQLLLCCYIPFDKDILKSVIISPNNSISCEEVEFALGMSGFNVDNIDVKKSRGSLV